MKKGTYKTVSAVLIIMLTLTAVFSSVANAASTQNLLFVAFNDDDNYFTNYDFLSEDSSDDNVDWAVSVVFWGADAEVDNAKALLWSSVGSDMHLLYDDGQVVDFDQDSGRKSDSLDLNGWHARLYAPSDTDRFEYELLDYYVVATTHKDWLNHLPWGQYGYTSEAADEVLEKAAETVGGDNVQDQFANMYNYEAYREEGPLYARHVWDCDGWARGVEMD